MKKQLYVNNVNKIILSLKEFVHNMKIVRILMNMDVFNVNKDIYYNKAIVMNKYCTVKYKIRIFVQCVSQSM